MDDREDRGGREQGAGAEDMRRWGYDPSQDRRARGVDQDERQFGGDRGWGGYSQDRRGDADDPEAPRGRHPWHGGEGVPRPAAGEGARRDWHAADARGAGRGGEPQAGGTGYHERAERGRQGDWLAGGPGTPGGSGRGGGSRSESGRDDPAGDERRPGLAGQSLYGPGDWGGRDGMADRSDRAGLRDEGRESARDDGRDGRGGGDGGPGDRPGIGRGTLGGEGGYGGAAGIGGMGSQGPWGPGADRGGRSAITRRGGWGGYGGYGGGGGDDPAGRGDMGGFGGIGHADDDAEPELDAEREPGRASHLATGAGGSGDWQASAAGSGQRRGPVAPDQPFEAQTAPGRSYGGWDPQAGSMQARWSPAPVRRDPEAPMARGPKGWRPSDERIRDDVCVRLSHAGNLDVADVSVDVRDGHVTLSGTVSDRPMKHAIEHLVDGCRGVQDIENRIRVMRTDAPSGQPPRPRASVPGDSPSAREEAAGRHTRLSRDGSGYLG